MLGSFGGLEVAKRALHAQQTALYTTGHNIANANTAGYTRQRVNFNATTPFPPASRNRPQIPGQIGTGVEAGSIERIRDSFIDKQYRQENAKVGYYTSKADIMSKMETILNEPSEAGLSHTMDQFWQALQDLSVNPEDSGARSVVKERAIALAESFQYVHSSLQDVRANLKNEIGVGETDVNSIIDQINQLNGQIAKIEPHGYVPNDLYDQRDSLIDELSEYVDINVSYRESTGQPSPIAEGIVTITLNTENTSVENNGSDPITLVNGSVDIIAGSDEAVNHVFVDFDNQNNVQAMFFAQPDRDLTSEEQIEALVANYDQEVFIYGENYEVQGKLNAIVDGAGYLQDFNYDGTGTNVPAGEYNEMLDELDVMVEHFVNEFNAVHKNGYSLVDSDGDGLGDQGIDFFVGSTADTIDVAEAIKNDTDLIAASSDGASGDGENAISLADVYTKRVEQYITSNNTAPDFVPTLDEKASIKSYFESIIGEMGVKAEESIRMQGNSEILRKQVVETR
ncbi:flagellar hook-associated protein FlgK, partial [Gracilibacillus dipsosauri]